MKPWYIILSIILVACSGNTDADDGNQEQNIIMDEVWVPPIDTMEVIEENYWEANTDLFNRPIYLFPTLGSTEIFGKEFHSLFLEGDSLVFYNCNDGDKYDFKARIIRVTEDSLELKFVEENEFIPIGSLLSFENDKKYFHKDFNLQKISYSMADPLQQRYSFSVEFDSTTFVYKEAYVNGGGEGFNCHKASTPKELFADVEEMLSQLQLSRVFVPTKDVEFYEPYKLLIEYNGKSEKIEGYKYALNPRLRQVIKRIEAGGPRNHEFLEMLGFMLPGDEELTRLKDYRFEVGEIELENVYPTMIEDMPDLPEEIEDTPDLPEEIKE
ncbi:hypothetical protein K6119_09225 [Paracrocinitomix mangrovi]|uniref:hypothetical protein n=1 Tax=Paracrocinitomix mangrovi TaxID=2862509 RepID=UPI001C8EF0B0|nr:hypothetical protein [Paracrocinitomix mangrovi]UKN03693.1 hypothetical protein K6119_09225 [Paracrocinitomix mangrovi]